MLIRGRDWIQRKIEKMYTKKTGKTTTYQGLLNIKNKIAKNNGITSMAKTNAKMAIEGADLPIMGRVKTPLEITFFRNFFLANDIVLSCARNCQMSTPTDTSVTSVTGDQY